MATSITATQLTGTMTGDYVVSATGQWTGAFTLAQGSSLELPTGVVISCATNNATAAGATINGALKGAGQLGAIVNQFFYLGANADLSQFTGTLVLGSSSTGAGRFFYGSAYTFPGTLTLTSTSLSYTQPLTFTQSNVVFSGTNVRLEKSVSFNPPSGGTVTFPSFGMNIGTTDFSVVAGATVVFNNAYNGQYNSSVFTTTYKGPGTAVFAGNNGTFPGTLACTGGTVRITGTNSLGTTAVLTLTSPAALEIAHGAAHTFATLNPVANYIRGTGTAVLSVPSTGVINAPVAVTFTSQPDATTSTAGDFTLGTKWASTNSTGTPSSGPLTGNITMAPDGGLTGGKRNVIRVYSAARTTSLTIDSGLRTSTTPAAGQEGIVIIYASPLLGTAAAGTTTVTNRSVLRVNSPDGAGRLCNGLVTVQNGATFETEFVSAAAASVKGRHVYPGGLTLATGSRLNIGVTPL